MHKCSNDFPEFPEQTEKGEKKKALPNVFIPRYKTKIDVSYLPFLKCKELKNHALPVLREPLWITGRFLLWLVSG